MTCVPNPTGISFFKRTRKALGKIDAEISLSMFPYPEISLGLVYWKVWENQLLPGLDILEI